MGHIMLWIDHFYTARASVQNMGQQMSGPDSSKGWSIQHESKGWRLESPSGRDIFCLKNFDTFTRTPIRLSKMNAVACAQLTFRMLTLLKKFLEQKGFLKIKWFAILVFKNLFQISGLGIFAPTVNWICFRSEACYQKVTVLVILIQCNQNNWFSIVDAVGPAGTLAAGHQ